MVAQTLPVQKTGTDDPGGSTPSRSFAFRGRGRKGVGPGDKDWIGEVAGLQIRVEPRTKPIVFWGVWLYFGPTAAIAGTVAYTSLARIFSESPDGQEVAGALAIAVICGLYLASSCWALWAVTAGCFKRR